MARKSYPGKKLVVRYEISRCIHAAECVKGAPEVFDIDRKPWVDPDGAEAEKIVAVVDRCPSGALSVCDLSGESLSTADAESSVVIEAHGPLAFRGSVRVESMQGEAIAQDTRMTLCRCGASANKPFCDGAHEKTGFSDAGELGRMAGSDGETDQAGVTVQPAPNGPLLVNGRLTLRGASASARTTKAALCRCGMSRNKPYCDGSHSGGFQAP